MKIADIQVIPFAVPQQRFHRGKILPERTVIQTLTKIVTDEGAEGYYLGGHNHGDQGRDAARSHCDCFGAH